MAVKAYRTITISGTPYTVEHIFECGTFDAMQAADPGVWTEVWRDCDMATNRRRLLWPFASGIKGVASVDLIIPDRAKHRKYFPANSDALTADLDLSDVNDGVLPENICKWMEVYQNGKKLPCEAYNVNYSTAVVTIAADWRVPGASYEVIFWANPSGGGSNPGT